MRNQHVPLFVALLLAIAAPARFSPHASEHFPTARASSEETLPAVRWRFQTDGAVSYPVVVNDIVFGATDSGRVDAVDRATGRARWQFQIDHPAPPIAPGVAIAGGTVFVTEREVAGQQVPGMLYVLDAESGVERWRRPTAAVGDIISTPSVSSDVVVIDDVDGGQGSIYALDIATGRELWRAHTGVLAEYPLPVDDGAIVAADATGELTAFDIETGQQRWRAELGSGLTSAPVAVGGAVYARAANGSVFAFDLASGGRRWRVETGAGEGPPPFIEEAVHDIVVSDGRVFVPGEAGLIALDASTGEEQWRSEIADADFLTSPTVVNGIAYLSGGRTLLALDARSGAQRWRVDTGDRFHPSPLALVDGTIYAGAGNRVYAFSAASGRALWRATAGYRIGTPPVVDGVLYFGGDDGYLTAVDVAGGSAVPAGFLTSLQQDASEWLGVVSFDPMQLPSGRAYMGLWRARYAPGSDLPLIPFPGPAVVMVAGGAVRVNAAASGVPVCGDGVDECDWHVNEAFPLPPDTILEARNDGAIPADLLVLAIVPRSADLLDLDLGALSISLEGGSVVDGIPPGVMVSIDRRTVAPGASLVPELGLWPAAYVVEAGGLELASADGEVQSGEMEGTASEEASVLSLGAENAAFVSGGRLRFGRNGGTVPLVVTVVEVEGDIPIGYEGGCSGRCVTPA